MPSSSSSWVVAAGQCPQDQFHVRAERVHVVVAPSNLIFQFKSDYMYPVGKQYRYSKLIHRYSCGSLKNIYLRLPGRTRVRVYTCILLIYPRRFTRIFVNRISFARCWISMYFVRFQRFFFCHNCWFLGNASLFDNFFI